MSYDISKYNNALTAYKKNKGADTYNNVLSQIPSMANSPSGSPQINNGPPIPLVNTGGADNAIAAYNAQLNDLNGKTNSYYGNLAGFAQKNYDLTANNLNTQNTNLLGAQDQNAQTSFLDSVLNPLQKQQGSLEYGYNLGQNHENATYGLNSTANQQNRDLALSKLSNDQNWANQQLNLNQGNQNASTIDSLNGRGLLYGQTPTGAFQGEAMGGMNGLAGQQAGRVNQDFANQRGQLQTTFGLNQQGVNQDYTQQQNMLNENHGYNTNENAFNTSNNILDQNRNFAYQTGQNNNQLASYQAQLRQKQYEDQQTNKQTAKQLSGGSYA